eukprot:175239-Chlamydomonas_euryale.AAC.3
MCRKRRPTLRAIHCCRRQDVRLRRMRRSAPTARRRRCCALEHPGGAPRRGSGVECRPRRPAAEVRTSVEYPTLSLAPLKPTSSPVSLPTHSLDTSQSNLAPL